MKSHFELVLKNADVAFIDEAKNFHAEKLNIGISSGRIAALSSDTLQGNEELNLQGLHILPGVIDTQVHFRDPGMTHKEDLESGTRAAALGGVCSVFEMPNTNPTTTTLEALQNKIKSAEGRAWVNFGFYIGASPDNVAQIASLEKIPGCIGVKVFMGSSTGTLLVPDDETLEKILRQGHKRVAVHAEDEERLKERKHIAELSHNVQDHPVWRDEETALKATRRILNLARKTGRAVHVLHVTSKEEAELLAKSKDIASFEITPNHLVFAAPECYEKWGTRVQMNPPIRGALHREALWKAITSGACDVIGTDHAPHTLEEKAKTYPLSPSGMPGVQTVVPLLLNFVSEGRLTLERMIQLTSFRAKELFSIPDRGSIARGQWADLTVVDLKKTKVIEDKDMATKVGWTPFAGMKVTGVPTHTIINGHIVVRDEALVLEQKGKGQKIII
jgi:dihydroorotase